MKPLSAFLSVETAGYLAVFFLGLGFVLQASPVYYPDSVGYLQMLLNRSCGYPLFLELHKLLFGAYFISAAMVSQYTLCMLSAFYLVDCLKKTVSLHFWFSLIVLAVLIVPVFMGMRLAQLILSESLAYPLYLFITGKLLLAMSSKKMRYFYQACALTLVLIAVRGQFLFVVPVLVIAVLLTFHQTLLSKKTLQILLCVLLVPVWATLIDTTFHKLRHNQAVSTPWTGIQVISIPFFVADENDAAVFKDPKQKEYFNFIYAKLKQKKLLSSQQPTKKIEFFCDHYTEICNRTIHRDGLTLFDQKLSYDQKIIRNNEMTMAMTLPLLKDNFSKWLKIYTGNFISGFDTSKYFLLSLLLLILATFDWLRKKNRVSAFIILAMVMTIANVALVSAAEAIIQRYTFYNNWILIAIVLLLFQQKFYNKTNE